MATVANKLKTYKGKSLAPGGGGKFAQISDALEHKGMSEAEAKGTAANMGRKKYGPTKFAAMGAAGRERAEEKGEPAGAPDEAEPPKKGAPRGPSAKRAVHPNFARHQFGSPHRGKAAKSKRKTGLKTYHSQRNGY